MQREGALGAPNRSKTRLWNPKRENGPYFAYVQLKGIGVGSSYYSSSSSDYGAKMSDAPPGVKVTMMRIACLGQAFAVGLSCAWAV